MFRFEPLYGKGCKIAARALLAALALCAVSAPGHAAGFLANVEDLPLMDGLSEEAEASVVFAKPDGRIVNAVAMGPVSAQSVRKFYLDTLPQLGWRRVETNSLEAALEFRREGERLEIAMGTQAGKVADGLGGMTRVHFTIIPE